MTVEQKSIVEQQNVVEQKGNDRSLKHFDVWEKYALNNGMNDQVRNMHHELNDVDEQKHEALKLFDQLEKSLFMQELSGLKTDTLIAATNLNRETWIIDMNNMIQMPIMK